MKEQRPICLKNCCQVETELIACIVWTVWTLSSDLRAKARRWDEKQLGQLKNRKEKLSEELKEWVKKRRKESELSTMRSQIKGYETRLKYSVTDRDNLVSMRVQGSGVWLWRVILSIYYLTMQIVVVFEIFSFPVNSWTSSWLRMRRTLVCTSRCWNSMT